MTVQEAAKSSPNADSYRFSVRTDSPLFTRREAAAFRAGNGPDQLAQSVNFGSLPFAFVDHADYDRVDKNDRLRMTGLNQLANRRLLTVESIARKMKRDVSYDLSER
jgi:hypothetical protein